MTRATQTQVTSRIRQDLKQFFPGVKFSVRQGSGTAIKVEWQDGPMTKEVKSKIQHYEAGQFDGMTDSYDYKPAAQLSQIDGVEYSVQYLQVVREWTPETENTLRQWAREYYDLGPAAQEWDYDMMARRQFAQTAY